MKSKYNIKEIFKLAGTYISVCIGSGFATGWYVFFGLNHFDFGQNFTFYIVLESIEIANEKLILKGLKK